MDDSETRIRMNLRGAVRTLGIGLGAGLVPVGFGVVVEVLVERSAPVASSGQIALVAVMAAIGVFFAWLSRESGHSRLTHFAVSTATPALLLTTVAAVQGAICLRDNRLLNEQIPEAGDSRSLRSQRTRPWPQRVGFSTVFAAEQPRQTEDEAEATVNEFRSPRQTFWDEFLKIPRQHEYVVQIGHARNKDGAAELLSTLAREHGRSSFAFRIFRYDGGYVVTFGDQAALPDAVHQLELAEDADIPDAELRRVPK